LYFKNCARIRTKTSSGRISKLEGPKFVWGFYHGASVGDAGSPKGHILLRWKLHWSKADLKSQWLQAEKLLIPLGQFVTDYSFHGVMLRSMTVPYFIPCHSSGTFGDSPKLHISWSFKYLYMVQVGSQEIYKDVWIFFLSFC
jgi:hypothetical protein